MFTKRTSYICQACHREATIEMSSLFKSWRWRVKYCPFCGGPIGHALKPDDIILETEVEKQQ